MTAGMGCPVKLDGMYQRYLYRTKIRQLALEPLHRGMEVQKTHLNRYIDLHDFKMVNGNNTIY